MTSKDAFLGPLEHSEDAKLTLTLSRWELEHIEYMVELGDQKDAELEAALGEAQGRGSASLTLTPEQWQRIAAFAAIQANPDEVALFKKVQKALWPTTT